MTASQKRAASDQKLYLICTVFWVFLIHISWQTRSVKIGFFQTARKTDGHAISGMAVSKIKNAGS
jgi:hypothetical protein